MIEKMKRKSELWALHHIHLDDNNIIIIMMMTISDLN